MLMKQNRLLACLVPLLLASSVGFAQDVPNERQVLGPTSSIGDTWMVDPGVNLAVPDYPAARSTRHHGNVCIVLGYRIGKDGTTSDFSLLKQWNSRSGTQAPTVGFLEDFANAGADAVSQWKFKPRPDAGEPASTYTTIALLFPGDEGIHDPGKVLGHCQIADMDSYLIALNRNVHRRDSLDASRESAYYGATRPAPPTAPVGVTVKRSAQ